MNQVKIQPPAKAIAITADPTKEKYDALGKNVDFLALLMNTGGTPSGLDPDGGQSVLYAGVETAMGNAIIATIHPSDGESGDSVFSALAAALVADGINATYSSESGVLSLTEPLEPDQLFLFANTDTGLSMSASVTDTN